MSDQAPPEVPIIQDHSLETFCHLLGLVVLTPIPFGNVLAPLILWFLKRQTNPGVDLHGKEAVNFQISMSIYMVVAGITIFIGIGIVLLPAVIITDLVLTIIAAVKASKGEFYHYPITIRFIN